MSLPDSTPSLFAGTDSEDMIMPVLSDDSLTTLVEADDGSSQPYKQMSLISVPQIDLGYPPLPWSRASTPASSDSDCSKVSHHDPIDLHVPIYGDRQIDDSNREAEPEVVQPKPAIPAEIDEDGGLTKDAHGVTNVEQPRGLPVATHSEITPNVVAPADDEVDHHVQHHPADIDDDDADYWPAGERIAPVVTPEGTIHEWGPKRRRISGWQLAAIIEQVEYFFRRTAIEQANAAERAAEVLAGGFVSSFPSFHTCHAIFQETRLTS
jgi:hypothetical protein